jgi:hypothetical protein
MDPGVRDGPGVEPTGDSKFVIASVEHTRSSMTDHAMSDLSKRLSIGIRSFLDFVALTLACLLPLMSADHAHADGNWAFGWANDQFFGSDNQFTNGFWLQNHGSAADSWDEAGQTPAFGRNLARRLLPQRAGLYYRESWTFGQNMQTPNRIGAREVILDDVPFVGMLGWANSHIAFNDSELTGIETLIGWVGPAALAEPLQRGAHRLSGASTPEGWRNQLDFEPVLNIYATRKWKIASSPWQDLAIGVDGALGNFFTHAQATVEWRIGRRRPLGFMPLQGPVGRSISYDGRLRTPGQRSFYGSVALRGTALGFALPREGNLFRSGNEWTENNRLSPRRLLGQLALGLHLERPSWGAHLQVFIASESFKQRGQTAIEDPRNNFGILSFEWKFDD